MGTKITREKRRRRVMAHYQDAVVCRVVAIATDIHRTHHAIAF